MEEKKTWFSVVTALCVIAVLAGLPIIYEDYYYNIMEVKYYYYCGCVIVMLIGVLLGLFFTANTKKIWERIRGQKVLELFTVTDLAHIAFLIVAAISTLLSPFKFESFWGNEGRLCGLFLIILYTTAYFCITRFFRFKLWYVELFLAVGLVVCLFGLTDFFEMDLLGFEKNLTRVEKNLFTSFIGNINFYTELVVMYLGVAAAMWIGTKSKIRSAWYYVCICITFLSAITGQSDNVYLAIGALFAVLPIYAFRTTRGVRRYLILVITFLISLKIVEWIGIKYKWQVVLLEGIFDVLVGFSRLNLVICLLCIITLGLYVFDYVTKRQEGKNSPWLWRGWLMALIVGILGFCYILYDVNIAGHGERYKGVQGYLLFNDEWGSARGFVWRLAIENYRKFPLLQKIFGHGPDTFGLITYFNNMKEMRSAYNLIFENAHNEYLQYFITIGPLGLLAYLTFLVSAFINTIKKGSDKLYVLAVMTGVFCYVSQAIINISQPIVTPIMWTLLSMGMAGCRSGSSKT